MVHVAAFPVLEKARGKEIHPRQVFDLPKPSFGEASALVSPLCHGLTT
jgi:hypothetical protein